MKILVTAGDWRIPAASSRDLDTKWAARSRLHGCEAPEVERLAAEALREPGSPGAGAAASILAGLARDSAKELAIAHYHAQLRESWPSSLDAMVQLVWIGSERCIEVLSQRRDELARSSRISEDEADLIRNIEANLRNLRQR